MRLDVARGRERSMRLLIVSLRDRGSVGWRVLTIQEPVADKVHDGPSGEGEENSKPLSKREAITA